MSGSPSAFHAPDIRWRGCKACDPAGFMMVLGWLVRAGNTQRSVDVGADARGTLQAQAEVL
jgi:hypothetical protein